MTTVLIPTIIGRSAGLADHEIRWILFATLVSAAVIAMLQPLRLGRFGSGLAMLGGASPAFIGVAGVALASGGPPLLSMLTLCSLPAAFVFVRYAHRMRRVLQPVVMGTIIMLVASSLANVVWRLTQQPLEGGQDTWISPAIFAGGAVRQMRTNLRLPNPTRPLGRKKAAPLGESGGTGLLEVIAV